MRIAVTGANGFIGRTLIEALLARGHQLRALVRFPDASLHALRIETIATGPIESITDWRPYLTDTDCVVHLAARVHLNEKEMLDEARIRAINTDATLHLARSAARRKVRHFLYLSSISVHGDETRPGHAFSDFAPFQPKTAYARSKADAERGLQTVHAETGMAVTCLRPPLVYGPGARGNFRSLCRLVRSAPALPFLSLHNRRAMISAGNLSHAMASVLEAEASGHSAHVINDGEFSLPQLVRLIAAGLGRHCLLLPAPKMLLLAAARLAGRSTEMRKLIGSLQVDSAGFRMAYPWSPLQDPAETVRQAAASFAAEQG